MYKKLIFIIGSILSFILLPIIVQLIKIEILDNNVLVKAVRQNDLNKVKKFLNQGLSVDTTSSLGLSLLMEAILQGNVQMVQLLLESGANVNYKESFGELFPMFIAIGSDLKTKEKLKIMKILLDFGANINDKNGDGISLLLYAIDSIAMGNSTIELFDFLLQNGIDVNISDIKTGLTPLIYATLLDNLYMVKALLKNGADVNAFDKNKQTSLSCAVLKGNLDIVKNLLSKGADVHIKDEFGQELILIPFFSGNKDMVYLLLAHGASIDNSILKNDKYILKLRNFKDNSIVSVEILRDK